MRSEITLNKNSMPEGDFITRMYGPVKVKVRNQLGTIASKLHRKDTTRKDENYYMGEPSLPDFYECDSSNGERRFFIIPSGGLFKYLILEEDLSRRVTRDFPDFFGTNDAKDVLVALWKYFQICNSAIEFERFCKIAQHEQFAWVVEYNDEGIVGDKILRLDLYRKLDEQKVGGYDFTGGLMHVFKHFSCYGHPLSYQKSNNEVPNLRYILRMIIEAFFMADLMPDEKDGKQKYIGSVNYKETRMKALFYNNEDAGVWFIDSFYENN